MKALRFIYLTMGIALLSSCSVSRRVAVAEYPKVESCYEHKGILEECVYKCSVEGPSERRMLVYLPADYYDTSARYPVFYLLHGARGNEMTWITKGDLMQHVDSLTANGLMEKTIVVMPNTNQHNDDLDYGKSRIKGAMESFYETDGMVEYAFVSDVVAKVDSTYRTIPEKRARAIGGLSIGGLQSIHISANNPDVFDYVGMFSPMAYPFLRYSEHASFYTRLKKKQKAQFATPPQLYWVMIGRTDFFYPHMQLYCNYLKRKGYKHEYLTTPGGHQWHNWKAYCTMFMERLWK